jgi:hypothetical protein
MKIRVLMTVIPAAVLGGIILLLGCGAEPKNTSASDNSPVIVTATATATSETTTNTTTAPLAEAVPALPAAPPKLSPGVDEIVQLAQAGVGDGVLLAYVENSPTAYQLDVEEILYLHDLGISAEVIGAMARHGQTAGGPPPGSSPAAATGSTAPVETASVNTNPPASAPENAPPNANAYAITPPVQQVTYNYFYSNLAPYGTWIDLPEYGWCWQPTVAVIDVGWRPYCNRGRWLWSDCGWYWQSDYSWGWAPFHYGRWHRSPAHGWVWFPDTTWAPAWVTWRYSDSYCGWAPLPPGAHFDVGLGFRFRGGHVGVGFDFGLVPDCFTFIPTARFCDRAPWHYRLPPTQVVTIFNRTTIINNYGVGPNHRTIVNLGPGRNAIAAVSRNEIRKVALRDVNPGGTFIKADRLDRDGKTLAVFRPELPKQASAPPPEITHRQQELRKRADILANSEVVRVARAEAEKRTAFAPAIRGAPRAESSRFGMPSPAPARTESAAGTRVPQTAEPRGVVIAPERHVVEPSARTPASPAISRNPRFELRNAEPQRSPALVRPSRQEREAQSTAEVAPRAFEPRRSDNDGRSVLIQPAQRLQPEPRPRPTSELEERPQVGNQFPPANSPSFRQESRRPDSGFAAPPADPRSRGQSITPPLVIQPRDQERRFSSPEYRSPQNFSPPPASAPRVIEAPTIRPSSPGLFHSPPPTVSRAQPAVSAPPPASRPSTPPSQSRGESRRN